jgi:hypothetical protein
MCNSAHPGVKKLAMRRIDLKTVDRARYPSDCSAKMRPSQDDSNLEWRC